MIEHVAAAAPISQAPPTNRSATSFPMLTESGWKRLRQLLLLIAIVHQAYYCYRFPFVFTDRSCQTAAAKSFAQGEPFLIPRVDHEDLSKSVREPLSFFPLGYPVLLAPFVAVLEGTFWPTFLVDALSTIAYFTSWYVIIEKCSSWLSYRSQTFVWLMWAFGMSPLIVGAPSDLAAEAFFSCGLALLFVGLLRDKPSTAVLVAAGFSTGLAATMRYAYWPLMAVVPASIFVAALGMPIMRRAGMAVAAACAAAVPWAVEVTAQASLAGQSGYVNGTSSEPTPLHWDHLLRFFPFPTAPLGIDKLVRKAELAANLPPGTAHLLLWLISLALLFFVVFAVGSVVRVRLFQSRRSGQARAVVGAAERSFCCLITAMIATVCLVVAMLAGLSIKTNLIHAPWTADGLWTYVEEPRYYLPTSGFLLLLYSAVALSWVPPTTLAKLIRGSLVLVLVGCALACSAGRIAADVGIVNSRSEWSTSEGLNDDRVIAGLFRELNEGGNIVFYCDFDKGRRLVALSCGAVELEFPIEGEVLDARIWKTSRPVSVVVALDRREPAAQDSMRELVHSAQATQVGALHDADLYLFLYPPNIVSTDDDGAPETAGTQEE